MSIAHRIDRRILLAGLGLAALAPLLARTAHAQGSPTLTDQDQTDLARAQAYLNQLRSMQARFVQVAPGGQQSTGTTWLERPGRMRFQYDPPSPLLLVAGGGQFIYEDTQLRQITRIPIGRTPLGLLLAPTITLSGDVAVVDISHPPGQIMVTVTRAAAPGEGSLQLLFADQPMLLRGWVVTDAQRQQTRVDLSNLQSGGSFDPALFQFTPPPAENGG